jgi:hypothetical protein
MESKPGPVPRKTQKKCVLEPDPGRWEAVRRDLILTLALRCRIFQGAESGEEAMERARQSFEEGAEKRMGFLKFDTPASDI